MGDSGEADVRFLYCACAICALLDGTGDGPGAGAGAGAEGVWASLDVERAVAFVLRCITYEGGIAVIPGEKTV
jgi:prenyltransferase beta subunit